MGLSWGQHLQLNPCHNRHRWHHQKFLIVVTPKTIPSTVAENHNIVHSQSHNAFPDRENRPLLRGGTNRDRAREDDPFTRSTALRSCSDQNSPMCWNHLHFCSRSTKHYNHILSL